MWLLFEACSAGCTAMTGIEAFSNGMTVFAGVSVVGSVRNTVDLLRGDSVTRGRGDWESAAAPCPRVSPSPRLGLKSTTLGSVGRSI
jgi:hypothetical protein